MTKAAGNRDVHRRPRQRRHLQAPRGRRAGQQARASPRRCCGSTDRDPRRAGHSAAPVSIFLKKRPVRTVLLRWFRCALSVRPAPAPAPEGDCLETFDRELDYMFGTLQRLGARPADIDDLLQEIFLVLYRNWPTLDTTRSLRPWLFGVAFRVVRTHRRRRARETPHARLDPEDGAPTPEAWLQGQESLALLSAALEHVPVPRRSVVIKHDLEGLEIIDIARQLSITKFGVYARLYKGRQGARLRRAAAAQRGRAGHEAPRSRARIRSWRPSSSLARSSGMRLPSSGPGRSPAPERSSRREGRSRPRPRPILPLPPPVRARGEVAVCFGSRSRHRCARRRRGRRGGRAPRSKRALAAARRRETCSRRRPARSRRSAAPSSESPAAATAERGGQTRPRPARPAPKADLFTAELDLLQRAHARLHAARLLGRADAGRGARATVPARASRRAARGVARAVPGRLRTCGRSASCRGCVRGPISTQRSCCRGSREARNPRSGDRRRTGRACLRRRSPSIVAGAVRGRGARGAVDGAARIRRRAPVVPTPRTSRPSSSPGSVTTPSVESAPEHVLVRIEPPAPAPSTDASSGAIRAASGPASRRSRR